MIPFQAEIEWAVRCVQCGEREILGRWAVIPGSALPLPALAEGWRVIDGGPVCPRHRIEITGTKVWVSDSAKKQRHA